MDFNRTHGKDSRILRLAGLACLVALASALPVAASHAQALVPVNLYSAELTWVGGTLRIGAPKKLTGDRGISSQPSFTPEANAILFVSRRDSANAQSDIYRIDLATGAEDRITNTPEMENSPTITPDGKLMVIRWIPATLFKEWGPWIYDIDGRPAKGVLPSPDTVGYYARLDSVTFAMMRPKSRPAIAIFDTRSRTMTDYDWPVANLPPQLVPGKRAISYARTDSLGRNRIRRLDLVSKQSSDVAPALRGRTVHTWTQRGTILMGRGNKVFALDPAVDTVWRQVAAFSDPELQSISSYVISPAGDKVILISPVKPALHTAIRDSLQSGRSVDEALLPYRGRTAPAIASAYDISSSPLIALAVEQARKSQGAAAMQLVQFIELVAPADAERARNAVAAVPRQ